MGGLSKNGVLSPEAQVGTRLSKRNFDPLLSPYTWRDVFCAVHWFVFFVRWCAFCVFWSSEISQYHQWTSSCMEIVLWPLSETTRFLLFSVVHTMTLTTTNCQSFRWSFLSRQTVNGLPLVWNFSTYMVVKSTLTPSPRDFAVRSNDTTQSKKIKSTPH